MDNGVHRHVGEEIRKMGFLIDNQLNLGSQWRLYAQLDLENNQ